ASRLIQTTNDADLTISNLTLRKGKDDIGGAILVPTGDTNLTLIDCTLTENESTGGGGGALFFNSTGTLTIQNGSFSKNIADADGGGAIFMTGGDNTAQHQMEGTSFTENQVLGGQGGALFVGGNYDEVKLLRVLVTENSALDSNGGGVAASFTGDMILENCRIQGNESNFAGGVYFTAGSGTHILTVMGSEILENKATTGAGGLLCSGSEISCDIQESLFRRNEAAGGPGGGMQLGTGGSGSHSIVKSIFEGNRSVGDGGGLYFTSSKGLNLTESQFLGNTANDGRGGGVFASSGGQAVNVAKCVVQDNQ